MYNTFSITFYCRKSKQNSKGLAPIEVRVTQNGNAFVTSLPFKANPRDFKLQMLSKKQNNIKAYTNAVARKIDDYRFKLFLEGKPLTKDALQTYIYYGFTEQHYTVGSLFQGFLSSQMKKVDAGLSTYKNYRKYEIVRDLFYKHSGVQANNQAMAIKNRTIEDFNSILLTMYDSTTVAGMMQKLKSVILYGIRNKMLKENPFFGFKISRKEKEVEFLVQEEVNRIREAVLPTERLSQMRD